MKKYEKNWAQQYEYNIVFSHKNPQIIGKDSLSKFEQIKVKNVQTSPQTDLDGFMKNFNKNQRKVVNEKMVKISPELFDSICSSTEQSGFISLDLEKKTELNSMVMKTLEFSELFKEYCPKDLEINPIKLVKDSNYSNYSNSVIVEYEFKVSKSGVFVVKEQQVIFEKDASSSWYFGGNGR